MGIMMESEIQAEYAAAELAVLADENHEGFGG